MPPATLEFWFDFGSNYSYLSVMRIEALARERHVAVAWKPFLLGVVFQALGWETSPFVLQKIKGDYAWRDMARQCDKSACRGASLPPFPARPCCPCAWPSSARTRAGSRHLPSA